MYDYSEFKKHKAYKYMQDCVNDKLIVVKKDGEIINFKTPRYVKLQCKNILEDLEKQNDEDYPYYFDMAEMKKIINLTKIINLGDGLQRGISCYNALAPFQWVIIINLFCWRYKNNSNKRRFESCLISLSRKNGKTALVGIMMVLLMLLEGKYSQFYSLAPNRELSTIIKNEMNKLIESSPLISKYFKNVRTELRCNLTKSTFQPLAFNENRLDSRQISSFVCDEVAEFPSNSQAIESMTSGMQNVVSKLGFLISTAYPTQDNLFESHVEYSEKVLERTVDNSTHFSLLFRPDEQYLDDYLNENCIFQSNPLAVYLSTLDIFDNLDFLYKKRQDSIDIPSTTTNYKTKLLNIPINSAVGESYLDLDDLRACRIKDYDWTGREVHLGLDLSFSQDNCGLAMLTYDNKLRKYVCETFCFIPADTIENKMKLEKVDYRSYCQKEWCYAIGDRIVDYAWIENFIVNELTQKFGVKIMSISFDKYNATSTIAHIEENTDIECVEVPQSFFALHPAIKKLKDLILTQEFAYVENNLFEMNCTNAMVVWNPSQSLCRVSKKASRFKIDILMALICAMVTIDLLVVKESVYETEGITFTENPIFNMWDF